MAESRYKAAASRSALSELDGVLDQIEREAIEPHENVTDDTGVESDEDDAVDDDDPAVRESSRMPRRPDVRRSRSSHPPDAFGEDEGSRRGALVAGKYQMERVVGRVGHLVEVEALHVELGHHVTIKYVLASGAPHSETVARFLRSARATSRIQSDHVARVLDIGRFRSGRPYVVSEALQGWTLDEVLRVRGRLPVQEAVEYCIQISDAIGEAHGLGIVHRSLHPGNVVLTRRADDSAVVKVLNFGMDPGLEGVTRAEEPRSSSRSSSFRNAHTSALSYVSPEQIRGGDDVDERADIWALGSILHALLAGGPAFRAPTAIGLLAVIAADEPPLLSEIRDDIAPDLEAVVRKCLAKDKSVRFADVSELVTTLMPFASGDALRSVERVQRLASKVTSPPPLPSSRGRAIVPSQRPPASTAPVVLPAPAPAAAPRTTGVWLLTVLAGAGIGAFAAVVGGQSLRAGANGALSTPANQPQSASPAVGIPAATEVASGAVATLFPAPPHPPVMSAPTRPARIAEKTTAAQLSEPRATPHRSDPPASESTPLPRASAQVATDVAPAVHRPTADLFDDTK